MHRQDRDNLFIDIDILYILAIYIFYMYKIFENLIMNIGLIYVHSFWNMVVGTPFWVVGSHLTRKMRSSH